MNSDDNLRKIRQRISDRRKSLKMSYQDLADKTGMSKSTLQRYETGDIGNVGLDKLEILAKALEVEPPYLMGWTEEKSQINSTSKNAVPLLGTIAAGLPIMAEENIESYFEIDPSIKADFCLRIKGDSMIEAGINDGDIAFLRKQQILETGEIGAVIIENEATLKRFYRTNSTIILHPENKDYQPIVLSNENVHIAGKLVAALNIVK